MNEHAPVEGRMKGNLNTILVSVTLAVLLYVGTCTMQNTVALAEIKGSLISRQEIDAKLTAAHTEIQHVILEVQEVKLEIAKMKALVK